MTARDLEQATWRKSTRSNGQGQCVEVATNVPDLVLVRDSKDPAGPALGFSPLGWAAFVTSLKADERP